MKSGSSLKLKHLLYLMINEISNWNNRNEFEHLNNYWTGNTLGGNRREYCENSNIVTHQTLKEHILDSNLVSF